MPNVWRKRHDRRSKIVRASDVLLQPEYGRYFPTGDLSNVCGVRLGGQVTAPYPPSRHKQKRQVLPSKNTRFQKRDYDGSDSREPIGRWNDETR